MGSSWADVRAALEGYFQTNWDNATPVKFENVDFVQPGTQNMVRQPWVSLYIRESAGWQASLGTDDPLRRFTGFIINQVFTDLGIGTNPGLLLARDIADIWRGASIACGTTGRIFCHGYLDGGRNTEPQVTIIGDDKAGWFQINVTTRFRREDYF